MSATSSSPRVQQEAITPVPSAQASGPNAPGAQGAIAASELRRFANSHRLQVQAERLIPGGTHTYAKGPDQYPLLSPGFIESGHGCRIRDVDGNEYIEYAMGLRAVTLGHAYGPVVEAAKRQLDLGNNFNRPGAIEVEAAETLLSQVPWAEMVKFTKDGSTAVTAGLKLARAHTGRALVAICADSPFFSYDDWFIGTTAMDGGIAPGATDLILRFRYNDLASLEQLFDEHPDQIAMVLLEPARGIEPAPGFLEGVRDLTRKRGALLMFDEMVTGYRYCVAGAHQLYGIDPDLASFGKAIANGFSVSAIVGRRDVMDLGGLTHDKARVFLLSTTHGAEHVGLAAAIATMKIYEQEPVIEHLYREGARLREGFEQVARSNGLADYLPLTGRDCALTFGCLDLDGKPSQEFRTLFLQELVRGGVLAPSLFVSYSHDREAIEKTIEAADAAMRVYARAVAAGSTDGLLIGPPSKIVYRRFN